MLFKNALTHHGKIFRGNISHPSGLVNIYISRYKNVYLQFYNIKFSKHPFRIGHRKFT